MGRLSPIVVVIVVALAPLLACGQSGTPAQGAVNQALGNIAKGVAAQAWSGTVTITQFAQNTFSKGAGTPFTSQGSQKTSNDVVIMLTKGIASAGITFHLTEITDQLDHYDGYDVIGNVTEHTVASGTNNKDASVKVSLNDDGTYEIEYRAGGIDGKWDKVETSKTDCHPVNANCQNTSSQNTDNAKVTNQGYAAGSVNGTVNKSQPNVLAGTTTEPFDTFSGAKPGTTTITWKLTR